MVPVPVKEFELWKRLIQGLRFENRFSLEPDVEKFVKSLLDYALAQKTQEVPEGEPLYRSRLHDTYKDDPFPLACMTAPRPEHSGHGRLNPSGIPYLYLSSDALTSISEVRPWTGAKLTVAEFRLNCPVKVVNLRRGNFNAVPDNNDSYGIEFAWHELIGYQFSVPVDQRDATAYVPTQYLAERFKRAGFQGIRYDSALCKEGYNVVLFDVNLATPSKSINVVASLEDPP